MPTQASLTIAVASGKGGTGKTLLASNLAAVIAGSGSRVALVDCDAEAPNDHLFFATQYESMEQVQVTTALVDPEKCTACGACREACAYGAIRILGDSALVFDELCHGCGLCRMVCAAKAISEPKRAVGSVEVGKVHGGLHDEFWVVTGRLDIGDVKTPDVIRAARAAAAGLEADVTILDAPPGVACAAVAAVRGADALVLVTEPTPFGLHDLDLSVRLANDIGIPVAIVVNRAGADGVDIDEWARERSIPVLLHIPFDRDIARTYAEGKLVVDADPRLASQLACVHSSIRALVRSGSADPCCDPARSMQKDAR